MTNLETLKQKSKRNASRNRTIGKRVGDEMPI